MNGSRTVVRAAAAWVLVGAAGLASAQTYTEGFDNVAALPAAGWMQVNTGAAPRQPWDQGNEGIFPSFSGAPGSFVGANYLSAGSGVLDTWLISPVLTIDPASQLSFYTRSAGERGFTDVLEILWSSGSGSALGGFGSLLTIGSSALYPASWTQFVLELPNAPSGRFAFRQRGLVDEASYIGVDSVRVTLAVAPVPEPETWALMGAGIAALAVTARRRRAAATRSSA